MILIHHVDCGAPYEHGKVLEGQFPKRLVLPDTRLYFGKGETAIPNKEQAVSHIRLCRHFYLYVDKNNEPFYVEQTLHKYDLVTLRRSTGYVMWQLLCTLSSFLKN
jgi:uncharacterized protein (UPF0548 family)